VTDRVRPKSGPHTEAADVVDTLQTVQSRATFASSRSRSAFTDSSPARSIFVETTILSDPSSPAASPSVHDRVGVGRLLRDTVGGADEESSVLGRHRRTLPTVWDEPRVSGDFPL
jgi:hypothetical protein